MTRPRIRTVKPEMWADEKIGDLSRDARLLFIGLITMADDDGRLRAQAAAIVGHVFPYDEISPRQLEKWLTEIATGGLLVRYEHKGKPYIVLRGWGRHQKINRKTDSELPPPPDNAGGDLTESSLSDHGGSHEDAGSAHPLTHAGALPQIGADQGSGSSPPDPPGGERPTPPSGARERDITAYRQALQEWAPHVDHPDDLAEQAWQAALPELRTAKGFELWLSEAHVHRLADGALVLGVPAAKAGWIRDRYQRPMEKAVGREVVVMACEQGVEKAA